MNIIIHRVNFALVLLQDLDQTLINALPFTLTIVKTICEAAPRLSRKDQRPQRNLRAMADLGRINGVVPEAFQQRILGILFRD